MLSSPVYAELQPRPLISHARLSFSSSSPYQPSNLPTCEHADDCSNSRDISISQCVTLSPTHRSRKSFNCNTYEPLRKCCKQKTYGKANSFRCNTYKKQGVGARPSAEPYGGEPSHPRRRSTKN